jgi:hypothetical protein
VQPCPEHAEKRGRRREGLLCDIEDPDTASMFTYMGSGIVYDTRPFLTDGVGWPLYLGTSGDSPNNK